MLPACASCVLQVSVQPHLYPVWLYVLFELDIKSTYAEGGHCVLSATLDTGHFVHSQGLHPDALCYKDRT